MQTDPNMCLKVNVRQGNDGNDGIEIAVKWEDCDCASGDGRDMDFVQYV
jgi:hypothetical protein